MVLSSPPGHGALQDRRGGGTGRPSSATALTLGAAATGMAALAVDTLSGEHPTHTLALAVLVVAIVVARRVIAPRFRGLLNLLNAAVVSQPALHLAGKWLGHGVEHSSGGLRTVSCIRWCPTG